MNEPNDSVDLSMCPTVMGFGVGTIDFDDIPAMGLTGVVVGVQIDSASVASPIAARTTFLFEHRSVVEELIKGLQAQVEKMIPVVEVSTASDNSSVDETEEGK